MSRLWPLRRPVAAEAEPSRDIRAELETTIADILGSATTLILDGSLVREISPYVEADRVSTSQIHDLLKEARRRAGADLLDFGCGAGSHRPMLESLGFNWRGIDYSPTASQAARDSAEDIRFYDGLNIPHDDDSFDVVFSFLVFEHIQDIHKTFSEIKRVLRPGGMLVGQVAYLEQVHDYSTFNFTPIGMKGACATAGLTLERLYPSFDAIGYLLHRLSVVCTGTDATPFQPMINPTGRFHQAVTKMNASMTEKNLLKLTFSTHFLFVVSDPRSPSSEPSG